MILFLFFLIIAAGSLAAVFHAASERLLKRRLHILVYLALAALGIGTAYGLLRWTGIVVFPSDHTWSADFFDASWRDDGVQFLVLCGAPFAGISAALLGKRKKSGSSQIEEKM